MSERENGVLDTRTGKAMMVMKRVVEMVFDLLLRRYLTILTLYDTIHDIMKDCLRLDAHPSTIHPC